MYTVQSFVDASNALGATVRTKFTCSVSTGAADGGKSGLGSWTLELLTLD